MYLPVLSAPLVFLSGLISLAVSSIIPFLVYIYTASIIVGSIGSFFHLRADLALYKNTGVKGFLFGPPPLAPAGFIGLGILGLLATML